MEMGKFADKTDLFEQFLRCVRKKIAQAEKRVRDRCIFCKKGRRAAHQNVI